MKYIQKFDDHSKFRNKKAAYNNLVALCDLESHIHYGQDSDYANECFSIKILSGEDATIELHYDPSGNGVNSIHMAHVPVNCDSKTGEIFFEGINSQQIDGQNGTIIINGLNAGDQIWLYTAGHMFMPWVEEGTEVQHGAIEFNMDRCTVSLQGNLMSLFDDDGASMPFEDEILGNDGEGNIAAIYYYLCHNMFYQQPIVYANNLILPLKNVPAYGYKQMFKECAELKTIPQLPATKIGTGSYHEMFRDCTSLEDISYLKLPYMSVTMDGWRAMFYHCTALKKVMPELRFTQSRNKKTDYYNCASMFGQCTSLVEAPALYIEYTGTRGLQSMFSGCTSLTTAPVLKINQSVYHYTCYLMFNGCSKLVNVFPELTFSLYYQHCFREMFKNCTSLEKAPKLISRNGQLMTTGSGNGYNCYRMFIGCSKLNYLDVSSVTVATTTHGIDEWLDGVASTGTFVTIDKSLWTLNSISGIPSGWTVKDPNGNIL